MTASSGRAYTDLGRISAMKSALLRPYPVRTSASAHAGKYSRATLAQSIVSDRLSRRRAAASRSRSARPI
jgi:hypothetical protein